MYEANLVNVGLELETEDKSVKVQLSFNVFCVFIICIYG